MTVRRRAATPAAAAAGFSFARATTCGAEKMRPEAIHAWLAAEPVFREAAAFVRRQGIAAYLVGGTGRDLLGGRASYDMDLAGAGDAKGPARGPPGRLGGA